MFITYFSHLIILLKDIHQYIHNWFFETDSILKVLRNNNNLMVDRNYKLKTFKFKWNPALFVA